MSGEFTGTPPTFRERLRDWFAPRGFWLTDGLRLAAINTIGIVVAMGLLSVVSLISRGIDRMMPMPFWFSGVLSTVIIIVAAIFVWYRYSDAYGDAARLSARGQRTDVFAAIAAAPFVLAALFFISGALFGIFVSIITFSGSRAIDALQRLIFALIFVALAIGNIIVARAGAE